MGLGKIFATKLPSDEQVQLIKKLHQLIIERAKPRQILLFGSAARGEMTTASDLDVVVVIDAKDQVKSTQKSLSQLSRLMGWPVDCLVIDQELFDQRSSLGGIYAIAKDEGLVLSEEDDDVG